MWRWFADGTRALAARSSGGGCRCSRGSGSRSSPSVAALTALDGAGCGRRAVGGDELADPLVDSGGDAAVDSVLDLVGGEGEAEDSGQEGEETGADGDGEARFGCVHRTLFPPGGVSGGGWGVLVRPAGRRPGRRRR